MATLGKTAPVASVTVPTSVAPVCWPNVVPVKRHDRSTNMAQYFLKPKRIDFITHSRSGNEIGLVYTMYSNPGSRVLIADGVQFTTPRKAKGVDPAK